MIITVVRRLEIDGKRVEESATAEVLEPLPSRVIDELQRVVNGRTENRKALEAGDIASQLFRSLPTHFASTVRS